MKPEEALTILDQATALAPLTRQQHQQVVTALETLKELVQSAATKVSQSKKAQ